MPQVLWGFSTLELFLALCMLWGFSPLPFQWFIPLASGSFLTCLHWSCGDSREATADLWSSLYGPLYCTTLPMNSSHFWLCGILNSVSSTLEDSWAHLGSPSLLCVLDALYTVDWDSPRSHLVCFTSLRDHYPMLLPVVYCLNFLFHIFCPIFSSVRIYLE